jgi:hypothetical protein
MRMLFSFLNYALFVGFLGIILPQSVCAESKIFDAPFGLKWGASIEDTLAHCYGIKGRTKKDNMTFVSVKTTPKNIEGTDKITLVFGDKLGLIKIVWIGDNINNDVLGTKGRRKYEEFKSILTNKYAKPAKLLEYSGLILFKNGDEFYQCLKYDGCGIYLSYWKLDEGEIFLQLKGLFRGIGFMEVMYEHKNFSLEADEMEETNKAKDKDAL